MRSTLLAVLLMFGVAHAQGVTSSPGASQQTEVAPGTAPAAGSEAPPRHRSRRSLAARFEAANTTHDGHLTAEQARAKMPAVARDFAAIDTANRGYVTLDEIRAYNRSKRAARRAAKNAAQPEQTQ